MHIGQMTSPIAASAFNRLSLYGMPAVLLTGPTVTQIQCVLGLAASEGRSTMVKHGRTYDHYIQVLLLHSALTVDFDRDQYVTTKGRFPLPEFTGRVHGPS